MCVNITHDGRPRHMSRESVPCVAPRVAHDTSAIISYILVYTSIPLMLDLNLALTVLSMYVMNTVELIYLSIKVSKS